jgi:hypothetical protein
MGEGLLAMPIKLPGTKFSKALQVEKDSIKPTKSRTRSCNEFQYIELLF